MSAAMNRALIASIRMGNAGRSGGFAIASPRAALALAATNLFDQGQM
jgi:hypothetical protein